MKAFKLFENTQLKNLSSPECNNNNNTTSNGKSANNYIKNVMESKITGDALTNKSKLFKQRMSSSTSSTSQNSDANRAAATSGKECIEKFLSSNVPSDAANAATVETARNGFLAAAAAAQQYTQFNLFTPYLKDMFFAAQLLRGNIEKCIKRAQILSQF